MSKVEERGGTYALHKASEKLHDYYGNAMLGVVQFDGYDIKNAYIDGYHQAERDLELTWEDIPKIFRISEQLKTSWWFQDNEQTKLIGTQVFWEEVLKRFKEKRKEL